jgi:dephospho-CoA kinase
MTKPIKVLRAALEQINRAGLSQLLFNNKSEVACNQRLCKAINKNQNEYLARVEYTSALVSRADLVMIDRKEGDVVLCAEAKTLTATNVMYPTKGEKNKAKKGEYHPFFDDMKKNIADQKKFKGDKIAIMWIYGWDKLPEEPEAHLREKYFSLRSRIKKEGEFTKKKVEDKIKEVFEDLDLIKIHQKTLMAEDEHEGYKAYMIATLGEINK